MVIDDHGRRRVVQEQVGDFDDFMSPFLLGGAETPRTVNDQDRRHFLGWAG